MRMRRKKNLVPRMENCAQWLIRDPQALRGNWRSLMPTAKELRLDFFAPEEVDLIYINFCDPWPPKRHAKRRLTHRNFLLLYRQVLKEKGEIHFKTDNVGLFAFSVTEFPFGGFQPQQVTHDLHKDGVQGIMTDYEEKFHNLGTKINRCVAVKGELPPQQETSEPQQNSAQAE